MDLLKAEIERKRKATSALIDETNPSGKIGSTRFVRQSDIIEQRAREQVEKQAELDRKRQKVSESSVETVRQSVPTSVSGPGAAAGGSAAATDHSSLTVKEVKSRLRAIGQPVTLFGESEGERVQRLRLLELNAVEEEDFMLTAAGHGSAGTGGARAVAAEQREEEDDDEEEERAGQSTHREYTFEPTHFAQDKSLPKRKVIYKYFRFLLKCWEHDLNQRPEAEKTTAKGKMETRTQKQCKDYIRYLFKLCKRDEVPFDIEHKLHLLVGHCEDGDFRAAHDEYLQAAIGKAAWPIGLTMVGIHERSGRERISTSKVAHVMNNEAQRKYFTSVKRLMTYAQKKRTDIAPSMKVLG